MEQSKYRQNSNLKSLADYLFNKEDMILKEWKDKMTIQEEQPSSLAAMSQKEFYDSIPKFIESICNAFRSEENNLEETSREHGGQRWELGFDLRVVTKEWSVLHLILMDQINEAQEIISIDSAIMKEAQKQLAQFTHDAIKNSVDEFYKAQRMEAETKVEDLEATIRENSGLNMQRGQNLRQASHDVGGSLVVMKMNISFLKQRSLDDEASELVEQLSLASEDLSELLNNLLDLFRLEAGREYLDVKKFDVAERR